MGENTNSPGVIGQMYENRKTGEIGVLESRDEKYKTLLFRGKEGNSFSIANSSFRSNWRKYTGDEVIETSSQKEQKSAKKEKAVEQAKEDLVEQKAKKQAAKSEDKRTQRLNPKEKRELIDNVKLVVEDTANKHLHDVFNYEHTKNDGDRVFVYLPGESKKKKVSVFIVYTLFSKNIGKVRIYTTEEAFNTAKFSKKVGDIEAKVSKNPKEPLPVSFVVSTDLLSQVVGEFMDSIKSVYVNKLKQAEKEEKEKK